MTPSKKLNSMKNNVDKIILTFKSKFKGALKPQSTRGVCYRDSPCNEVGTVGGNKGGCSSLEMYPYFKLRF